MVIEAIVCAYAIAIQFIEEFDYLEKFVVVNHQNLEKMLLEEVSLISFQYLDKTDYL